MVLRALPSQEIFHEVEALLQVLRMEEVITSLDLKLFLAAFLIGALITGLRAVRQC